MILSRGVRRMKIGGRSIVAENQQLAVAAPRRHGMRFGAHYLPTYIAALDGPVPEFYGHLFQQMEELDALGFDDVWVTEHHFYEYGGTISAPPVFLAAVARTTHRINIGVAISILPLHDPVRVAEAYAMVDAISNGRLQLGVGRGNQPDFASSGIPYEETARRLQEGTEVIRRAWSDDELSFHGEMFDFEGIRVLPKPVHRPHPPIWVAASRSDDTFRWAGRNGFNLMTLPYSQDPAVLGPAIETYRDALVEAGHDPASREILGKFHIYVANTTEAALQEARPYLNNYRDLVDARSPRRTREGRDPRAYEAQLAVGNIIAGDPKRCVDIIHGWRERLGLTTISGTFHFGGMPQEMALKNIRLFAEQVMPYV